MRIGYFSSKFPYDSEHKITEYPYGGSVIATYQLVKTIASKDIFPIVFTGSKNFRSSDETDGNIRVKRYANLFKFLTANISPGYYLFPVATDVDIIHISWDIPPAPLAGLLYSYMRRRPVIVTYHGDWVDEYGSLVRRIAVKIINFVLLDRTLNRAKVIICPSQSFVKESKFLSPYVGKIQIIPNGIGSDDFSQSSLTKTECRKKLGLPLDVKIILFFGFLSPYKGPEILLQSFKEIVSRNPNTMLIFGGNGAMKNQLESMARTLDIDDKVLFLGFVKECDKEILFRSADIFCLPSTMSTESFGIVNIEAMAAGLPIVASSTGGIPDIVHDNINGFLVRPRDAIDLTEKLLLLLNDERLRNQFGINNVIASKEYSWKEIGEKTIKIYKSILVPKT